MKREEISEKIWERAWMKKIAMVLRENKRWREREMIKSRKKTK